MPGFAIDRNGSIVSAFYRRCRRRISRSERSIEVEGEAKGEQRDVSKSKNINKPENFLVLAQFTNFVAVGASSAVLSLFVRGAVNIVATFEIAVVAAHAAGMVYAFSINRAFVFPKVERSGRQEFARFSLINLMSLGVATVISSLCFRWVLPSLQITSYPGLIAHFIGLATCAIPSFIGHKFFSFGQRHELNGNKT